MPAWSPSAARRAGPRRARLAPITSLDPSRQVPRARHDPWRGSSCRPPGSRRRCRRRSAPSLHERRRRGWAPMEQRRNVLSTSASRRRCVTKSLPELAHHTLAKWCRVRRPAARNGTNVRRAISRSSSNTKSRSCVRLRSSPSCLRWVPARRRASTEGLCRRLRARAWRARSPRCGGRNGRASRP